jgi:hypothetical protein
MSEFFSNTELQEMGFKNEKIAIKTPEIVCSTTTNCCTVVTSNTKDLPYDRTSNATLQFYILNNIPKTN